MPKATDIRQAIEARLAAALPDAVVVSGWAALYMREDASLTQVIGVQPLDDSAQHQPAAMKADRRWVVQCGVRWGPDAIDRLEAMLLACRKALFADDRGGRMDGFTIKTAEGAPASFGMPETGEPLMFVVINLSTTYVETYR